MTKWHKLDGNHPVGRDQVVLVHIEDLGVHGIVSAWWDKKSQRWIALDDEQQFEYDRVQRYTDMIDLPDYRIF